MKWQRIGMIFAPNNNFAWMVSHASNPIVEVLDGTLIKVYFGCRDQQNRSNIGFVVLNLQQPKNILAVSEQPVLAPGESGYFDDSGVSPGCVIGAPNGKTYFYYLGWNLATTVPWRNTIGLAVSDNGKSQFKKYSSVPILDRSEEDPLTLTYPWVIRDGHKWRMWYGSNKCWVGGPHDFIHSLRYAESDDGITWTRSASDVLPLFEPDEYLMCRPCVIQEPGLHKMWYSLRGEYYKIGYAESEDGKHWNRLDAQGGLDRSGDDWDSNCVEYACVFDCQEQRYMLYNGNGFGATGFGLAVLN